MKQIELLRKALQSAKREKEVHVDACVVLPEHLHALWR